MSRMLRSGFFAALALSVASAAAALPGWQGPAPAGTRATAVSAAPDADAVVYAAVSILESSTSALYRSDDAGTTWTALAEAAPGDSYSEVFADPRDATRVFAAVLKGAGSTDVFRSVDGGETWSTVLTVSNRCTPSFAVGIGPDSLLLGCGGRLLRTPDAGLTWNEPAPPSSDNFRLTSAPGGSVFAYTLTSVFFSSTNGSSWEGRGAAPPGCPSLLALRVDPLHSNALLAGTGLLGAGGFQCGGVYASADGGRSWTASDLSGVYVTDVGFDRSNVSRVYACASFIAGILPPGGVYVSGDGGHSFSNARLPTSGALKLAVSPGGRAVYAATPLGVYAGAARGPRLVDR